MEIVRSWVKRHFNDPQAVILAVVLAEVWRATSIVMVIIGLLIGGILKGQAMIQKGESAMAQRAADGEPGNLTSDTSGSP